MVNNKSGIVPGISECLCLDLANSSGSCLSTPIGLHIRFPAYSVTGNKIQLHTKCIGKPQPISAKL